MFAKGIRKVRKELNTSIQSLRTLCSRQLSVTSLAVKLAFSTPQKYPLV